MSLSVDNLDERGLESIALDPHFGTNQFFYLYYSVAGKNRNRISRFKASGNFADVNSNNNIILSSGGGFTNHVFVASNGNVGIGTATSPDAKLSVKGTIHAQEIKVDLLGSVAPDYVFGKDYDLMSLNELHSYIECNQHLPDVPSGDELDENGLNLKQMNLLLLRKIEELTLYMIEQNKVNAEQRKEIEVLKKEVDMLKAEHP